MGPLRCVSVAVTACSRGDTVTYCKGGIDIRELEPVM